MTKFGGTSLFVIALALTACGGGGGGSSPHPATTSAVPTLSSTTNFAPNLTSNGQVTLGGSADTGLTLTLKNDAGGTDTFTTGPISQSTLTLNDGGNPGTGTGIVTGQQNLAAGHGDELGNPALDYHAQAQDYEVWGTWSTVVSPTQTGIGVFAGGNETPFIGLPTTGSATYNGTTAGIGTNATGEFGVTGTAQVIANFTNGGGNVTTNFGNFQTEYVSGAAGPTVGNVSGTGAMNGNTYTSALSGGGLSGNAAGKFYGPTAQETAGVFNLAGGGTSIISAFGATSVPLSTTQTLVPSFNTTTISGTIRH